MIKELQPKAPTSKKCGRNLRTIDVAKALKSRSVGAMALSIIRESGYKAAEGVPRWYRASATSENKRDRNT